MYAIIKTGGKQYKVALGDFIDVELLEADLGSEVQFEVLFVSDGESQQVGVPLVAGASVIGEVIDWVAGPKVTSVKYKPSHRDYRKFGHRQKYSRVKITSISGVHAESNQRRTHAKV
ncbi:MAG: 50S ribosomal protein L21 [Parachlamydiaceae bacterium]|nr:50S ribosomal protein L21 [Parachlamydiaceae bacterium]